MSSLAGELTAAAGAAFEALGLEARWGEVRRSDKPELADFQCNGAMGAAKAVGKPPREIAMAVAAALKADARVLSAEVAGPGFINVRVTDAALSARAEAIKADPMAGAEKARDAEIVLIDFGGPNVAKPMHVGHLRSAVIGDTLQRLMKFLGDEVTSDTHLGDWGLQMGHLITELQDEQPGRIYFDGAYKGPYPDESPVTIDDLARLYPAASTKAKADEARNARSQLATAELQAGRPGYRALLKHFIDVSVAALKKDYAFLNVSFDLWKGESDVDHLIPGLIERYKAAGLAEESDGAWIVPVAREGENVPVEKDGETTLKNPMPPVMLVNSRGGTGYHTTDLATILDRTQMQPKPERIIYVVDQRQAQHFEQVYRAADKLGLMRQDQLEHIGFGTVNGPDGKPFKTREGGVLRLADLQDIVVTAAERKFIKKSSHTEKLVLMESIVETFCTPQMRAVLGPTRDALETFARGWYRHFVWKKGRPTSDSNLAVQAFQNLLPFELLGPPEGFSGDRADQFVKNAADEDLVAAALLGVLSIQFDPDSNWNEYGHEWHDQRDLWRRKLTEDVAEPVAIAALRFADLRNPRLTNYIFDLDKFTSFEGKTGPYLLYAAVRVKSLLRKAKDKGHSPGALRISHDAERALVLQLDGFAAACLGAREKRAPHILCEHLYSLAQAFSGFYAALPIAAEADAELRASRLALSAAVLNQLERGLDILGINVPERM